MDTRITVHYDHRTRMWVCSPPGSWPTDWPTWDRAMDEAAWHACMLRDFHRPRSPQALRRRLRALQAQGYAPDWIASRIQARVSDVITWSTDSRSVIKSPTISRRIVHLYDWVDEHTGGRIRDTGPTPEALARNWAPPAAWDDIDDPDEHAVSGFTDNARNMARRRVPIPAEVVARMGAEIAAHNPRAVVLAGKRANYRMGAATVASRLKMMIEAVESIAAGRMKTIAADDLDRLMLKLSMTPEAAA
ncbi:hypothetical protein [Corynebacterium provencense]|uniref:hypothetical protein n=1 Tax=Corynebacterium provencense TaxID=1737425 RepID=UPI0008361724|nr:hypothetical protein [Corynebacterium provencense]